MKYPYFRGLEADRYSFYRVPKALIKVDLFEKMSGDAKLLYAVLLDRMNLSLKNGWQDENGNDIVMGLDFVVSVVFSILVIEHFALKIKGVGIAVYSIHVKFAAEHHAPVFIKERF